jgi:polysaccharide pyruvyl transferase WcaK-like protein
VKIGLVGRYGRGNFGDDLMAALLGAHLGRRGHSCAVLGLGAREASALGLSTAANPAELVERSDAVVLGGGALLARAPAMRMHRGLGSRGGGPCDATRAECGRRGKPLFLISVGGDASPWHRLAPQQQALVRACGAATVRHPEAAAVFASAGRPVACHPDLVLQTSRFFPIAPRRATERLVIGIDVYWSNLLARCAPHAAWLLWSLVRRRSDLSFVFLDSTHRDRAPFRALAPPSRAANAERYQFGDLREDLSRIAGLDLVLSSRLHVGVTALSYGVPFVSLFGETKTSLFLKHAGLEEFQFGHTNLPALLGAFRDRDHIHGWVRRGLPAAAKAAIAQSENHLVALDRMLREVFDRV